MSCSKHLCIFCVCPDHQGTRMTVVLFVLEVEWLLSTGQDKSLTWHCSESGQLLGTYNTTACVSGLQYPLKVTFLLLILFLLTGS